MSINDLCDGNYHTLTKLGEQQFAFVDIGFIVECDYCDGYRSALGSVNRVPASEIVGRDVEYRVRIESFVGESKTSKYGTTLRNGYRLTTDTGAVILEFGTDDVDDYYPSFYYQEGVK